MVSIHKIIMPHKKSNGFNNDTLDENIGSNSNTTKSDETSVYNTNDNDNSGYTITQVAQQPVTMLIKNQPSSDEINEVFINLKIIMTTPINTRISTTGSYLNHEIQAYYVPTSLKRWWNRDSREETIKKLDRIITRAILYAEITNRDTIKTGLYDALSLSVQGLQNIKETYSSCIQTSARIDTLIDKIASFTSIGGNIPQNGPIMF